MVCVVGIARNSPSSATKCQTDPTRCSFYCLVYAIGKVIQWNFPKLSENRLVVMFGAMHIEQG